MTIARKTRSRRKSKRVRRIRGTRRDRRIRGSRKVRTHYRGGEGEGKHLLEKFGLNNISSKLGLDNIGEKLTQTKTEFYKRASEASKYFGLSNTPTQPVPPI